VSKAGKVFAVAVLVALAWAVVPVTEAQPPIHIGASLSQTGVYAPLGQNQLRGVNLPKFHEVMGRDAEFVYGGTPWVPELVEPRAGGLIPIARQYPRVREFVLSYKKESPGANFPYLSAAGYGGWQIFVEATRAPGPWTARSSAKPL